MQFDVAAKDIVALRRKVIEKYFSNLNDMQQKAVLKTQGPVLIMAGAGSGKTTVLINRIANLLIFGCAYETDNFYGNCESYRSKMEEYLDGSNNEDLFDLISYERPFPWQILAITFTNKAAGELKERLEKMLGDEGSQVSASTFHSACVRILRSEISAIGYKSSFTIYDSDDSQRVVKECLKEMNLDEKAFPPRMIMSVIGNYKDYFKTPAQAKEEALKSDDFRLSKMADVYESYQKKLFSAGAVDFDDIITLTVKIFTQYPDILKKYQNRWKYIMVDEYQDTNHAQYKLISLLASGSNNLCVVGDDDQSIYKFRGADIENILSFEKQFNGANVIKLEQNYRSTQNILDAANKVICNNLGRKGKTLWTSKGSGEKIKIYKAQDERDEANYISKQIAEEKLKGRNYNDFAVLYRLNAQSATIESSLLLSGIPYKIVGGTRFTDRKEIKDIMAYLSVIENRSDILRIKRIINEPKRGIGDATIATASEIAAVIETEFFEVIKEADKYAPLSKKSGALLKFASLIEELSTDIATIPLDEMIDKILLKTGYGEMLKADGIQGETRLENINELKSQIKRYVEETQEPSLGGFLEEMALYTELDNFDEETDKVTLMTLHSAKGLEFPIVFIPGVEEGMFPSARCFGDNEELEEERRLCYVGITRAKQELFLIHARRRMIFGQTHYTRPSRFIGEIPPELIDEYQEKKPAAPVVKQSESKVYRADNSIGIGSVAREAQKSHNFDFDIGDHVIHKVFGEGVVAKITPMGNDCLVEINFNKIGTKKIMAAYARLQKI